MLVDEKLARDAGVAPAQVLLLMDGRARYLRQLEAARIAVETRYLAGHPALFPAELRRSDEARHETDQRVALGARLTPMNPQLLGTPIRGAAAGQARVGANPPTSIARNTGRIAQLQRRVDPLACLALFEPGQASKFPTPTRVGRRPSRLRTPYAFRQVLE